MSQLASKLADVAAPDATPRRGPANVCGPVYGAGDIDDWTAVENLRALGHTWREVQAHVDQALGVTRPILNDKFRYHWRRKCFCWTEKDRL